MYRNLNAICLGVSGRQSELIELAMSYRFQGIELDMAAFAKQAETRGFEHAHRYLDSAGLRVGTFELPLGWTAEESAFREDLQKLKPIADFAAKIDARQCTTTVIPASDDLPFQENFEFHQTRLKAIAEILEPHQIRLGLNFLAAASHRKDRPHEFIHSPDKLIALVEMVGSPSICIGLDLWNWHVGGGTIDQLKEVGGDRISSVRIADVPAGDLALIEDEQRLMPGATGVVPTKEYLRVLEEIGYDGPVTPYPHPSQFKRSSRDNVVSQAVEGLKSVWGASPLQIDIEAEQIEAEKRAEAGQRTAPQTSPA